MKLAAALLLFLLCLSPVQATSPDFDLCDVFQTFSRGDEVLFDEARYQFIDLPDDLVSVEELWVTDPRVDLEHASMYELYVSPSQQKLFVFAFNSLVSNADSNGQHNGNHDFCYPVRSYSLRFTKVIP